MTPIRQTAEYRLLRKLAEGHATLRETLNAIALGEAYDNGYVDFDTSQDFAHITGAGLERLEELEND